jgi:hypothetical protein
MTLDEQINQAILNLANSVKALSIATQQLHEAAHKMDTVVQKAKKPNLTVVDND